MISPIQFRHFAEPQAYTTCYQQMRAFTDQRTQDTPDQIWFLQHEPVFTQGQAGKAEHILDPGDIPIVQSDRGGQVTYHGPNQLMVYTLFDLKRLDIGIRQFVTRLEQSIILLLAGYDIKANTKPDAPGVYVSDPKICSLGLRVRKGCTYHGISLNVNMDLSPFSRINPCGFKQLAMTQISDFVPTINIERVAHDLTPILIQQLSQAVP
jgi:lipoyl(octanoyl) transferase